MQSASSQKRVKIAPNLYERGDRYFVIVRVNGEQRTKALIARDRTAAKKEAPSVLALLNGSTGVSVGDRSVNVETLVEAHIAHEKGSSGSFAANTLQRNEAVLRKHVLPALPRGKAVDLTVGHVRRLIDKLTAKGLSGASVKVCVSALSSALDYGVRNEILQRNVTRDLVRRDLPSGKRTTEPRYLSGSQVTALLKTLSVEFRPVAAALFYGGLRISEALALRWSDIDFEGHSVHVRGTKTAASDATIPLLAPLATILKGHRQEQAKLGVQRIAAAALVFPTYTGKPQSRRNALRAISNASVRAGLVKDGEEKVGCHDLRHSLAANAFALGLSPVEVSKVLRHANPQVTMTVYAGLAEEHVASLGTKLAALGGERA
jgi:integrase